MVHVSIGVAASMLGISFSTLRRWHSEGRLQPAFRTPGGHRGGKVGERVGPLHDYEKKQIIVVYLLTSDLKLPI